MTDPFCQSLYEGHEEGVLEGMPEEVYHASPGVSKSRLILCRKSMGHFRHAKVEPTPSMRLGTLTHGLILEGKLPGLAVRPDDERGNFRTKDGKQWRDEQIKAGLEIVTADEVADLKGMCEAIVSHKLASTFIRKSKREVSLFAKHPVFGLLLRGRIDLMSGKRAIADIKTTVDAGSDSFLRKAGDLGYDIQAAMYLMLCDLLKTGHNQFFFIAVEKTAPYMVEVYDATNMLDEARDELDRMLAKVAACATTNTWPTSDGEIKPLMIPHWVRRFK